MSRRDLTEIKQQKLLRGQNRKYHRTGERVVDTSRSWNNITELQNVCPTEDPKTVTSDCKKKTESVAITKNKLISTFQVGLRKCTNKGHYSEDLKRTDYFSCHT